MKRQSKRLISFALVVFFALGVLCATLATPAQSLASVIGCSQDSGAMEMTGCERPSYVCGFDPSSELLSQGAIGSARFDDFFKNSLGIAIGEACFDSSAYSGAFVGNEHTNAASVGSRKISIHLFNSVLTL